MIGLCINFYHNNYGGLLQALSTTQIFTKRGLQYRLIKYEKKKDLEFYCKSIPRLLNHILLNDKYEIAKKKYGKMISHDFRRNDAERAAAFHAFKEAWFSEQIETYSGYASLCSAVKRYTAFVVGSDQLWSPAGLPTNYYNLMFVPDEIRKIAYASSFGVKQIPWYQQKRTATYLQRIEYLSMRETRGSEIVEELTGRKVPTVIDPILMLSVENWNRLIPEKKEYEKPYLFAYFLGSNTEHRKAAQKIADTYGYSIVTLRHLDQYVASDEHFGDNAPYDVGPDKFLNLLRGAAFICTDSFHGSCLSIVHRKPFVVFNRYPNASKHSKNSRIDSLCEMLDLRARRFHGNIEEILSDTIAYDNVEKKICALKQDAELYLDRAFAGLGQ